MLPPGTAQYGQSESISGNLADSVESEGCSAALDATSCDVNEKASLPSTDNEAFGERLRGIEPPPEAWEASVLPLNYSRVS